MNLIDWDANREEFMHTVYSELGGDETNDRANRIIDAYDSLPTIGAVPVVYGQWIPCDYKPSLYCKCSKCGRRKEWLENMEWCPRCGAKMEKEADHA